jgi:hypothetical protein
VVGMDMPGIEIAVQNRGLNFIYFFGISKGIERKMKDIGKIMSLYFLQNV